MKVSVEIEPYTDCIKLTWAEGFEIACKENYGAIHIKANAEGLRSLASLCMTLAQDAVPAHSHVHLDECNCLEDGSIEMIIERI